MCVSHLTHYKDNHVLVWDSFLEKLRISAHHMDFVSSSLAPLATKPDLPKDQRLYLSTYSKLNSKSSASVNHMNLNTLT